MAQLELRTGEILIGIIGIASGAADHIILLPGDADPASQDAQIEWALSIGGELPDLVELALMRRERPDLFQPECYWSGVRTGDMNTNFGWAQSFYDGVQSFVLRDINLFRARAIRRVAVQP